MRFPSRSYLALIIAGLFYFVACSNSKYADLVPKDATNQCETSNMSYARDIDPILQSNCTSCHSAGNSAGGGIVLDNYAAVKSYTESSLIDRVSLPTTDGSFMPKGGSSIGSCNISKLTAWKDQGFPQ
jgi:hypothetical protein